MGCDIHLHTEVKIGGVWLHYGCPDVTREYKVFAKMAGVRNREYCPFTPLASPRGMPSNASALTRFACKAYGVDGHSHSWLGAKEISQLVDFIDDDLKLAGHLGHVGFWSCENFGYFFGNTWEGFWKYSDDNNSGTPNGVEDVRFVFWFDN